MLGGGYALSRSLVEHVTYRALVLRLYEDRRTMQNLTVEDALIGTLVLGPYSNSSIGPVLHLELSYERETVFELMFDPNARLGIIGDQVYNLNKPRGCIIEVAGKVVQGAVLHNESSHVPGLFVTQLIPSARKDKRTVPPREALLMDLRVHAIPQIPKSTSLTLLENRLVKRYIERQSCSASSATLIQHPCDYIGSPYRLIEPRLGTPCHVSTLLPPMT